MTLRSTKRANASTYNAFTLTIGSTPWLILHVSGAQNYIHVVKEKSVNRLSGIGRYFDTFDEATRAYKSPDMKTALLKIELNLF